MTVSASVNSRDGDPL